ncbi:hypothetical protein [Caballeronia insecticola]|uniref:Uncharacterized protein n=1 Tax=Caballeronia insecticola TaxID=758793 RepID=R4WRK6_9BURK|nr:hypothetical protein [Caballeronia insecticola]BAN27204.1 putative uncharacterized protein [Caballeronia insecticola]
MNIVVLLSVVASLMWSVRATAAGCDFSNQSLSFAGDEITQARCLLRPVMKGGSLGARLNPLPPPFEHFIGQPVGITPDEFLALLKQLDIAPNALGGAVTQPLSQSSAPGHPQARYFVIHDTSLNVCTDTGQFARSEDADASWNRASRWANDANAHLYITRDGKLVAPQGRIFSVPWRATKLEANAGPNSRGLFLHVENVQLRIAELKPGDAAMVNGDCRNDRIAQTPGLSDAQMQKLALTYIAASVRAKKWLIPAYHAAIDDGISNGHDDPQHFDLTRWGTVICSYLDRMGKACS